MEQKPALWSRPFLCICLSSFFLFMTFYTLATTLPLFVARELHGNQQQIGLVMTVFVVASVLLRPLAGQWLDQFGKWKVIGLSLLLFFIATIAYFGVGSMALLLALRFIHGGSFGAASTATGAAAIDLVPERRKGEGVGYFSLFMSLAMVIGPFVGLQVTAHASFTALLLLCCGFSLLALVFGGATRFPAAQEAPPPPAGGRYHWSRLLEAKALPISLTGFVLAFAYSSLTTFISVYASELGLETAASYFFVCFAIMIVLPRPWIGRWFDRFGAHVLVYPGVAFFAIGMISLAEARSGAMFLLSGAVTGLGYGVLLPCFQTLAVQAAPAHRRGIATGTFFLLFDLGYGAGSYVLGVVATHTHYYSMYLLAGVVVAFTAPIYYVLHHKRSASLARRANHA